MKDGIFEDVLGKKIRCMSLIGGIATAMRIVEYGMPLDLVDTASLPLIVVTIQDGICFRPTPAVTVVGLLLALFENGCPGGA